MATLRILRIVRRTRRFLLILPKFLLGFVCLYILLTIVVILASPLLLFRRFLFHVAKYIRSDLDKMVNAKGTIAMYKDVYECPKTKLVTGVVLEGCPSYDDICQGLKSAIGTLNSSGELLYPEMQQQIVTWMSYRFWKPIKNFNYEEQITYMHNTTFNYEQAMQLLKNESLIPFTRGKAVWKLILVPNYIADEAAPYYRKDKKYSFLLFTTHHGLTDGFSVVKFAHKILQVKYVHANPDPVEPPASLYKKIGKAVATGFKMPYDVGDFLFSASMERNIWFWDKEYDAAEEKATKVKSETANEGLDYTYAFSELIPFSQVTEVRKLHGVSSLAVIVTAISGAIRAVMFKSQKKIPVKVNSTIPTPIPNHPDKLRNHMTAISLAFSLQEPDPVKRLHSINRSLRRHTRSTIPLINDCMGSFVGSLPLWVLTLLYKFAAKEHTVGLSSFPGTKYEIPLFKDCVWKENFWIAALTVETNALAFAFTTYNGHARLLVEADRNILSSDKKAKTMCQNFLDQLELLKNLKPQEYV